MKYIYHMYLEKWSQYHPKPGDSYLLCFTENCTNKGSIISSEFIIFHITFISYNDEKLITSDQNISVKKVVQHK